MLKPISTFTLPLAAVAMFASTMFAGDWPQILGPHRNGVARGEQLAERWPASGPKSLWTTGMGLGYAGPVVIGEKVIVFHRVANVERIEAMNVHTGKRIWRSDAEADYRGGVNSDTGPRATPVVHGDRVYVFGAAGVLRCVALADGRRQWSRDAYDEFNGREGYFGAGSSPLVAGGMLLVNVGGRDGAGIVAFHLKTGETLWKAFKDDASYSSPTSAKVGGKDLAIFVTRLNTVALDPERGEVRFQFPFGRSGPTVNGATPLVFDNHLFVTSSYGVGARLVKIDGSIPQTVWSNDDVMSSQYSTAVYKDGFLYGVDGREDIGVGRLRCVDAKTGRIMWTEERFGVAHAILAHDKLLLLKVDGELVLAEASPKTFVSLSSAKISRDTTRALPALSAGRLFVRSTNSQGGQLKCLEVGAAK